MITFSQFLQEKFLNGVDTWHGYAEIYENPPFEEFFEITGGNTSRELRGILTGGDEHRPDDAYVWISEQAMHGDIKRHIPNKTMDYIPITATYNRMTKGIDVDVAPNEYSEENREKQLYSKDGIQKIITRIKNSKIKDIGTITLSYNIKDIAESFGVSIDNNLQENLSYSIKKRKSGDGVRYQIMQGRRLVGTIGGFEDTYRDQFHIFATGLKGERGDAGTIHGTGIYQAVVQHVANLYQNGAFVHTWESSDALKKALAKMPTHRIEGDKIIISPTV